MYAKVALMYFGCELYSLILAWLHFVSVTVLFEIPAYSTGLWYTLLEEEDRSDFLAVLFPRSVGCMFPFYSSTGSIDNVNVLCSLPLNNLHEKLLLVLRLCVGILSLALTVNFVLNLTLYLSRNTRIMYLKKNILKPLNLQGALLPKNARKAHQFGEFLILEILFKNMTLSTLLQQLINQHFINKLKN